MYTSQKNAGTTLRALTALASLSVTGSLWADGPPKVQKIYELQNPPSLSSLLRESLGISVADDHGFKLGGIGSGLWKDPHDEDNTYWMITDRGPNPQTPAPVKRTFPVPEFTPFIFKVKVTGKDIRILETIPLTVKVGDLVTPLTGMPNYSHDETPFTCKGTDPLGASLPFNPAGHDVEDLIRDPGGNFWTVEEYAPSISKFDPSGHILKRFVPVGIAPAGSGFTVVSNLPAVIGAKRKKNRGFEGIAVTPDYKTIYAVVQSPLSNPTAAVGDQSRVIRIVGFDMTTESVVSEHVYVMDKVAEFTAGVTIDPTEMKISALSMLNENQMLVLERTDGRAKIYKIDLRGATNVWSSAIESATTGATLESLVNQTSDTLAANGVKAVSKELIVDLGTLPGVPPKIEGMAILGDKRIVISNDNDFQVGPPSCGANVPPASAINSQILIIELDKPVR